MVTTPSSVFWAAPMLSIVMEAQRILPPLWSVWLPMISVRPEAVKNSGSPAPKVSS